MVQLIRMRPWYMPMMAPFDREFEEDVTTAGMNIYQKEGYVYVEAPVPGVPADKVDVTYGEGVLRIKAQHEEKEEEKEKKKIVYKTERTTNFEYSASVPTAIDEKSIEAEVKNGVVYVKAKIAAAATPRKIAVKAGN